MQIAVDVRSVAGQTMEVSKRDGAVAIPASHANDGLESAKGDTHV
jgi:hypothetical protein